jgi:hypothetical protein
LTTTVAPGTNPPPESTTTPVIDEVAVPCADADVLMSATRSTADTIVNSLRIPSPSDLTILRSSVPIEDR